MQLHDKAARFHLETRESISDSEVGAPVEIKSDRPLDGQIVDCPPLAPAFRAKTKSATDRVDGLTGRRMATGKCDSDHSDRQTESKWNWVILKWVDSCLGCHACLRFRLVGIATRLDAT